ncbi:hypothetical protein [Pseudomonas sp. Marseille-QA0892]
MRASILGFLACALLTAHPVAQAAERNEIPDCYGFSKVEAKYREPGSGRELLVIIDQTVPLPEALQKASWNQIMRFVAPGDRIRLYSFSAFLPNQYMELRFAGELNAAIRPEARNDIGMQTLRNFDKCLAEQQAFFRKKFGKVFVDTLREASEEVPRSEIFQAIRAVGSDMQSDGANDRVIFLISDMLENSDFGSFYSNSRIRDLNPAAELNRVKEKGLYADLQGARVYVAGAGLITSDIKQAYRSGKTMDLLQTFWQGYFEGSNATLSAFGTPSLNVDLR